MELPEVSIQEVVGPGILPVKERGWENISQTQLVRGGNLLLRFARSLLRLVQLPRSRPRCGGQQE